MTQLFSKRSRDDSTPMRERESRFEFFDRVADPYFEAVRDLLDGWFDHYPVDHQNHLLGRIKSNGQYSSAVWELYLHERFIRAGLTVEVDPAVSEGTPDFRLTRNGGLACYVEAMVDQGSKEQQRQGRARNSFTNNLETSLKGRSHALFCRFDSVGSTTPSLKQLVKDLDHEMADNSGGSFHRQFIASGWVVSIRAEPLTSPSPTVFVSSSWRRVSSYAESRLDPIRDAVEAKGKKYKKLDGPLVVAISTASHFSSVRTEDVANALFGTFTAHLGHDGNTVATTKNNDGVLLQGEIKRKTGVSGVVFAQNFNPAFIGQADPPTLYVNRHASRPLQLGLLPFTHRSIDPASNAVSDSWVFGTTEHDLFDLPKNWPGCIPFEEFNRPTAESQ
jgi:hypothetical protein